MKVQWQVSFPAARMIGWTEVMDGMRPLVEVNDLFQKAAVPTPLFGHPVYPLIK